MPVYHIVLFPPDPDPQNRAHTTITPFIEVDAESIVEAVKSIPEGRRLLCWWDKTSFDHEDLNE